VAVVIGVIEAAALFAVFYGLKSMSWIASSARDRCVDLNKCYCERLRPGEDVVKQPINTYSNVAFVLAGLAILTVIAAGDSPAPRDPMEDETFYAVLFGCIVVYLGPGSMFFHASMKKWGGWLDTFSMMLFTGFLFAYDVAGLLDAGEAVFLAIYIPLVAALGLLSWKVEDGPLPWPKLSMGTFCFGALAIAWGLLQILVIPGWGGIDRDDGPAGALLGTGLAVFLTGFVVQQLSDSGGPLCREDSKLQGHAVWHVLAAIAALITFFYLRTEIAAR
jgi:Ceramidase